MGIRINKQLGYGLIDVDKQVEEEDLPVDEVELVDLVNWESPLLKYNEEEMSLDNYLDWVEEHSEDEYDIEVIMLRKQLEEYDHFDTNTDYDHLSVKDPRWRHRPTHAVSRGDADGGLSNVLCITPVWLLDSWNRNDDTMDWIEETYFSKPGHDPQTSYVEVLKDGIYPYSGLWMHAQTGQALPGDGVRHWRIMKDHYEEHPEKYDEDAALSLDIWANAAGFDDHEDAVANCVPLVPDEVRHLVEFGQLFTSDDAYKHLRPMLYVYWR